MFRTDYFDDEEKTSSEFNERAKRSRNPERIVFLTGPVTDQNANAIVAELLTLEAEDPAKPIKMYINSPGGSVTAGLAIYDTMTFIKAPVHTIGIGMCASMASFLLAAGNPGNRFILPSATDMAHQPSGGGPGKATEIEVSADLMRRIKRRMEMLYADFIGVPYDGKFKELIQEVMHEDSYFNASMALKLGLVDKVVAPKDSKARDSQFKTVMKINEIEYEEIGDHSPKGMRLAKKLIEEREAWLAEQKRPQVAAVNIPANQP